MKKLLILIFVLSLVTRLFYLFVSIPSLSNDETDLYLSSYLLAKSGTDYHNNALFLTTGILTAKPSIPVYIGALTWMTNMEKNVINARLLFSILNSFTPFFFFLTIYLLTKNKLYSLIAFLIFNFSPWFSYISATGYEALISFLFINIALCLAASNINKMVKLWILLFIFFLIFSSYMAIRTYIPFLILITLFLGGYYDKKASLKSILLIVSITLLTSGVFFTLNYYAPNASLVRNEFTFMISDEKSDIDGRVWYQRLTTNAPEPLKKILVNKVTVKLQDYTQKYLSAFDTNIFFFRGDPSSLYGTAGLIGLFYLTDFAFFLFGLFNIRLMDKKLRYLLLFLAIGSIPIALTRTVITVIMRGIILLIPYTIIIAHGATILIKKNKKPIVIFAVILSINWLSYMTLYISRIVPLNSDAWQMNYKLIANKVAHLDKQKQIYILEGEAKQAYMQFLFYNIDNPFEIKSILKKNIFAYRNILYTDKCPKEIEVKNTIYIMKKNYCGDLYRKYIFMNPEELKKQRITINTSFLLNSSMSGDDYILIGKN